MLSRIKNSPVYTLAPLFLVLIIDTMSFGLVFPVFSAVFMDQTGGLLAPNTSLVVRDIYYAASLGLFCIAMFFGAPILGDMSDHLGRKKVILVCLSGVAFGYFVSALGLQQGSIFVLLLGRVISGFAAGSQPIAQAAIADISTEEDKAKNLSMMTLAVCIGFVFGPMVGGYFSSGSSSLFNYNTPFWFAGGLAIINAITLIFSFKETYKPKPKQRVHLLRGVAIFMDGFKHPMVRRFSLVMFLMQVGWSSYFQFLSMYFVQEFHANSAEVGNFLAFLGFWFAMALLFIIRICLHYLSLRTATIWALVVGSLSILLATILNNWIMYWICIIPTVISVGVSYTTLLTLYSNSVSAEEQGWVMGVTGSVVAAAWAAASILDGLLSGFAVQLPFIASAVLIGLAVPVMMGQRKMT